MAERIDLLLQNVVLVSAFTAWLTAQLLKVLLSFITFGSFDIERLVGSGGMPSSHTALVVSLAAGTAYHEGLDSTQFAIASVFAAIVMYDAAGVRNAAGQQAKVLNRLITHLSVEHTFPDVELKELLGHTPVEVVAGAALGMFIAYLFCG